MKILLIVLQVLGGVSFVPYPAILVANVMSIAAGSRRILFYALSVYPLVWISLWKLSWRLIDHSPGWAFGISSIPVICSVAGVVWFARSS